MSYKDQLSPWCLIRLLPKMQRLTVARFRRRSEAEAQLHLMQRIVPHISYIIIFDPHPNSLTSIDDRSQPESQSPAKQMI